MNTFIGLTLLLCIVQALSLQSYNRLIKSTLHGGKRSSATIINSRTYMANPRNLEVGDISFPKQVVQHELLTAESEKSLAKKHKFSLYVKLQKNKSTAGKPLSDEELSEMLQISKEHLQQLIQKGDHAKTVLVRANMRLVFHIARFYRFRGVSYPDLVQEGIVGLMKAVDKFDPDRGFRFSTYASWWIKQAVSRAIAEKSRIVRLPVHIHDLMISVSRAEKQFSMTHMRKPSSVELADQLALPLNKVELLLKCAKDVNSIDESAYQNRGKVQKDDMQVRDKLVSQIQEPSFLNQKNAQNSELHRAMKYLSEREAQIIEMRFGLLDGNEMTLEEIGKIFNVTRERIRQIEARALSKLRQPFKNEFRDTFTETLTLTDGSAEIEKRAMLF